MNIIKNETGVYAELPKDSIKFESKEAEIMYDLTLENDRLQQELQRKDNIINELNRDLEYYKHEEELYRYYQQENPRLMNNWNELKEELKEARKELQPGELIIGQGLIDNILDKIKELEDAN